MSTLSISEDGYGNTTIEFIDGGGDHVGIELHDYLSGPPHLYLSINGGGDSISLSQANLKELMPHFQKFIDSGKL